MASALEGIIVSVEVRPDFAAMEDAPLLSEHSNTTASWAQQTQSLREIRERFESLSPRHREACRLMVRGVLNREIAERLNASINTVKTHRAEVFRRMEAQSLLVQVLDGAPPDAGAGTGARAEAPAEVSATSRPLHHRPCAFAA